MKAAFLEAGMKEGEVFTKILRGSIRPRVGKLVARWVLGVAAATLAIPGVAPT
jgi:hypothetical protein